MPSNETAKTKWAPRRLAWILLLCAIVGLLYITVASTLQRNQDAPAGVQTNIDGKTYILITGSPNAEERPRQHGKAYNLTSVVSPGAQAKGLSGTEQLADNAGMLFWYDKVGERCFWMKDMRYALDIIWLDAQKRVVRIEPDLTPETYPRTYCAQARYGIELNAGEAAKSGIAKDQVLSF